MINNKCYSVKCNIYSERDESRLSIRRQKKRNSTLDVSLVSIVRILPSPLTLQASRFAKPSRLRAMPWWWVFKVQS